MSYRIPAGSQLTRIDPSSLYEKEEDLDPVVVSEMAKYYAVDVPTMEATIRKWEYDSTTAAYELLRLRRKKGHSIRWVKMPSDTQIDKSFIPSHTFTMFGSGCRLERATCHRSMGLRCCTPSRR